jgi:transcriptional regulator with XRE-family HTH domain
MKSEHLAELGSLIRAKRQDAGITQQQLGMLVGLSQTAIGMAESGVKQFAAHRILRIISILCSTDEEVEEFIRLSDGRIKSEDIKLSNKFVDPGTLIETDTINRRFGIEPLVQFMSDRNNLPLIEAVVQKDGSLPKPVLQQLIEMRRINKLVLDKEQWLRLIDLIQTNDR